MKIFLSLILLIACVACIKIKIYSNTSQCYSVNENQEITLMAPQGKTWKRVIFASYGTPNSCEIAACHSAKTAEIIAAACSGKTTCTISAKNEIFSDPCAGIVKTLQVRMEY